MTVELQCHWVKQKETSTFLNSRFYHLQNIHGDYIEYLKSIIFKLCKNVSQDRRAQIHREVNQQNNANK